MRKGHVHTLLESERGALRCAVLLGPECLCGNDIQWFLKHLYCKKTQKERKENASFYINEKNNLVGFIFVNMNKYVPMLTCCHS